MPIDNASGRDTYLSCRGMSGRNVLKILAVILVTVLAASAVFAVMSSDDSSAETSTFTVGGIEYSSTDGTNAQVGSGTQRAVSITNTGITIPSTVAYGGVTYNVVAIGDYAFYECTALSSVSIPDSVTSIGDYAFTGCYSLSEITIPDQIVEIGAYSFSYCTGATVLTIGAGVTTIFDGAFQWCTGLTSAVIPDNVTSVGDVVFRGCSNLVTAVVGAGVVSLGDDVFYGVHSMESVTVKDGNTMYRSVDGVLFDHDVKELIRYPNAKAGDYEIPDGVETIAAYAFGSCRDLTSVTIPSTLTSIGMSNFTLCHSIGSFNVDDGNTAYTSVDGVLFSKDMKTLLMYPAARSGAYTVPSTVTFISWMSFTSCDGLTSVDIPDGVAAEIGANAFFECRNLTSVTIGDDVIGIGAGAFSNCRDLSDLTLGDSIGYISSHAFDGCRSLTSVTIPDSVTAIGGYAFNSCTDLETVDIGSGVDSIGEYAFDGCNSLRAFTVDPNNSVYVSDHGVILNAEMTEIVSYPYAKTSYAVPDSVTAIDEYAFQNCTGLTSVTIGNGVTSIGEYAFQNCTGLTSVTIGSAVTDIGTGAFEFCVRLGSIEIPDNVRTIGYYAFYGCIDMASVIIGSGVDSIGTGAFNFCNDLTSITVSDSNTAYRSVDGVLFSEDMKILLAYPTAKAGEYTIPDDVTEIEVAAFGECAGLTAVTIGNNVSEIGNYAFGGCENLVSITVSDGNVTYCSVDGVLFNHDKTELIQYPGAKTGAYTVPNETNSLRYSAFRGCVGITSVVIGNNVTSIGDYMFYGCSNLGSITVDEGNSKYSSVDGVLFDKNGVTLIQFPGGRDGTYTTPDGTKIIGGYAFGGCNGLTSVTVGASVAYVDECAFYACFGLKTLTLDGNTILEGYAVEYCMNLEQVTIADMGTILQSNSLYIDSLGNEYEIYLDAPDGYPVIYYQVTGSNTNIIDGTKPSVDNTEFYLVACVFVIVAAAAGGMIRIGRR